MHLFRYETHAHTCETSPCGKVNACDLVRQYKEIGYHGIVITDHYYNEYFEKLGSISWEDKVHAYLKGYRAALEEGRKAGVVVLLGMELRFESNWNDYLVYGLNEEILLRNPELYRMTLEEFRELADREQLLIYQAHPFRKGMTVTRTDCLDGIEAFNGNPRHNSNNTLAYLFARENNLKIISGSDYHQPQDAARGGIEVEEELKTSADLVAYLKAKKEMRLMAMF